MRSVRQRSTVADTTYLTDYAYDSTSGQLDSLTYPETTSSYRLKLEYAYAYGLLQQVSDYNASSTVFWTATGVDARGNVVNETLGDYLTASYDIDAITGLPASIQSGPTGDTTARQDLAYKWDKVGNLTQRKDLNRSLTEDFAYDNLHRLDYSALNSVENLDIDYDAMGNITSKSDVGTGTWTYDTTKKHAVASIPGYSFEYDDNGNQIERTYGSNTDDITWTSYNYPSEIENGPDITYEYYYDGFRNRWKEVYTNSTSSETTIYVGDIFAKRSEGAYDEYRHFIKVGNRSVALYTRPTTGNVTTRFLLLDHQGSVSEITDDIGEDYLSESFTALGERRDPTDWDGPIGAGDKAAIAATTDRGYTFHTNLKDHTMIHMNGRVMDGLTGRFLSPDPYIPDAGDTQSFNRFSYVVNNPLTFVDPSGFDPVILPRIPIGEGIVIPRNGEPPEMNRGESRDPTKRDPGIPSVEDTWAKDVNRANPTPDSDIVVAPSSQTGSNDGATFFASFGVGTIISRYIGEISIGGGLSVDDQFVPDLGLIITTGSPVEDMHLQFDLGIDGSVGMARRSLTGLEGEAIATNLSVIVPGASTPLGGLAAGGSRITDLNGNEFAIQATGSVRGGPIGVSQTRTNTTVYSVRRGLQKARSDLTDSICYLTGNC